MELHHLNVLAVKKYLFGFFTFTVGLACGLLLDSFIRKIFPDSVNPMLQGAIIVIVVVIAFFMWRLAEKTGTKTKPETNPEFPKQ
ncbi:MAG TPA: hypothetical protein VNJ07_10355 [Chitinophagales bacterium]|nr:hypothetical protein [Chitinophagales bacterium]